MKNFRFDVPAGQTLCYFKGRAGAYLDNIEFIVANNCNFKNNKSFTIIIIYKTFFPFFWLINKLLFFFFF